MTNNSTKSRAGYLKKFTSLGLNIQAVGGVCGKDLSAECLMNLSLYFIRRRSTRLRTLQLPTLNQSTSRRRCHTLFARYQQSFFRLATVG